MTMALGSCQIHSRPWLALCFAGLLLLSAGSPCDARWLPLEKNHRKRDIISVIVGVVLLLVGILLFALLRQHCCRRGSPVGHATEEAAPEGDRSTEFSIKQLFSPFVDVVKVQWVSEDEDDDPKSISPTMKKSPCGSPVTRHWAGHVSLVPVRHHRPPLAEPCGQQNAAAATDSCLLDIAPVSQGRLKEFNYYLSLAKATKDCDEGNESRSGVLYAGHLLFDDTLVKKVAIKRFHKNITDCEQIREDLRRKKYMLQHRNLVTLFGYCLHDGKLYLVYDWMPYHSLDCELFAEKDCPHPALTLVQRQDIIKDAARGLLQLHNINAFHGAVKASNIMLEPTSRGFRCRLADFRYSTLLADDERRQGSEPATGTTLRSLLYPECNRGGGPSLETDVFYFGGMMLEVLCGRRLLDSSLLDWVQELDGEARLDEALDENAKKAPDFDKAEAEVLLRLALRCCNPDPSKRPTIRTVLAELSREVLVQTKIEPKQVRTASNNVRHKRKARSIG